MKTMKRNYKENGSALISVIIAGSIMSVILLGASQMIERQSQSTAFLEDRLSKVDFQGTLMGKLSDELACTNTINGLRVESEQNLARILEKDGSTAYSNNSSGVNNALSSFNKLSINQIKLINVSTANAPDQSGDMKIRVFPVRQRTGGGPQELAPFDVSIRVRTDSSRALAYCKAYGDGSGLETVAQLKKGKFEVLHQDQRLLPSFA